MFKQKWKPRLHSQSDVFLPYFDISGRSTMEAEEATEEKEMFGTCFLCLVELPLELPLLFTWLPLELDVSSISTYVSASVCASASVAGVNRPLRAFQNFSQRGPKCKLAIFNCLGMLCLACSDSSTGCENFKRWCKSSPGVQEVCKRTCKKCRLYIIPKSVVSN